MYIVNGPDGYFRVRERCYVGSGVRDLPCGCGEGSIEGEGLGVNEAPIIKKLNIILLPSTLFLLAILSPSLPCLLQYGIFYKFLLKPLIFPASPLPSTGNVFMRSTNRNTIGSLKRSTVNNTTYLSQFEVVKRGSALGRLTL